MTSRINKIITEQVLELSPYHVAEVGDNFLKLDAMECPQALPEQLKNKWLEVIKGTEINRYPAAHNKKLEQLLRNVFQISQDQQLMFGNGSDEFIQIITLACARKGAKILAPAPTFVMYQMVAKFLGLEYIAVDLKEDFSLDVDAMVAAIKKEKPAIIYLATPNNPTGNSYKSSDLQRIIDASTGLVVIDEAYMAFSRDTAKSLSEINDNVVVMRTLSKTGFAGLRFGYMFGPKDWIDSFNKVRPPYNINVLTQASIEFVMAHYKEITAQCSEIIEQRKVLFEKLSIWPECRVFPSKANFLLLKVPSAQTWFEKLKEQGVLVKNLHGVHAYLTDTLRLTVSNEKENNLLLEALEKCRT